MRKAIDQIRGFFTAQSDPYAGADIVNAQRLGALLWGLLMVLTVMLLSISPPDEAIGGQGWIVAGLLLAANLGLVIALRRRMLSSWGDLLLVSFVAVAGIALLQWLAGGVEAPYERLLLLPILFAAALHPPRRFAPLILVAAVALCAPLAYDSWSTDAAAADGAEFVIWVALAAMCSVLMTGVRAQRLVHAREEAEAREEARIDSLTGLHNRRAFDEAVALEVSRSRRLELPLSVAMVDVENFKEINDRWGHAEGDRCLREVAEAIRAALRRPDLCFRWGGDEFAVILSGTTAVETPDLADRITRVIAERCARPDGEPIKARFAAAELHDDQAPAELVARVGLALTEAKTHTAR